MTRRTAWLILRALVAVALLAAPAWVLATAGGAVPHQHWTLGALLAVCALAGVALLATTALAWRRERSRASAPAAPARPAAELPRARRALRATGAGIGLALLAVLAAGTAWLRPFPATDAALDALRGDDAVEVRESAGWYAFVPRGAEPTTGLVYSPAPGSTSARRPPCCARSPRPGTWSWP